MTVTYQLDFLQHVRAIRAINGALPRVRVLKAAAVVCFVLFVVLVAAGRGSRSVQAYLLMLPLILFPLLWIMPFYLTWLSRTGSRAFQVEQEYVFGPDTLTARGGSTSGVYDWSAITRVVEVRRFFLLYVSNQCAIIIPKDVLPGPSAVADLRLLLKERTGKPKKSGSETLPEVAPLLVEGRFQWRLAEGYRAVRVAGKHGPRVWPAYVLMLLLITGTSGPSLFRQYQHGGLAGIDLYLLLLALFPLGLILVGTPLASLWAAYSHGRTNRMAAGEQVVGLTRTGLHTAGGLQRATIPWDALIKVVETREFFLFYQTKLAAVFLPKRVLGGAADLQYWRDLLREHLSDRARLLTIS